MMAPVLDNRRPAPAASVQANPIPRPVMTTPLNPPFRADHVGSFLRPQYLLEAREQHAKGAIDAEQLRRVEDRAIAEIVKFQEDVGLKSITDGEFRLSLIHI